MKEVLTGHNFDSPQLHFAISRLTFWFRNIGDSLCFRVAEQKKNKSTWTINNFINYSLEGSQTYSVLDNIKSSLLVLLPSKEVDRFETKKAQLESCQVAFRDLNKLAFENTFCGIKRRKSNYIHQIGSKPFSDAYTIW